VPGGAARAGAPDRWRTQADGKKRLKRWRKSRLLEHDTAGDPMTDLRRMRKTTAGVATQLSRIGIHAGAPTVARLLRKPRFSQRVRLDELQRVLLCQRGPRPDAFSFERFVPALDLTVGLRVIG
jgi:hypothetical protein